MKYTDKHFSKAFLNCTLFRKNASKIFLLFILDWTCNETCLKNIHSNSRNLWQILYIQFVGHQQIRSNAVFWILSKTLKSFSSHNHWLLFYIRQIQEVIWINWINYYMHRKLSKKKFPLHWKRCIQLAKNRWMVLLKIFWCSIPIEVLSSKET